MDSVIELFEQRKAIDRQIESKLHGLRGKEQREVYSRAQRDYNYFKEDEYADYQTRWNLIDNLAQFASHPVIGEWLETMKVSCHYQRIDYHVESSALIQLGPIKWHRRYYGDNEGDGTTRIQMNKHDLSSMDLGEDEEDLIRQIYAQMGSGELGGVSFRDFHRILCTLAHEYHTWRFD